MILYISGLNSTYKPYIQDILDVKFQTNCTYYIITGNYDTDMTNLYSIINNHSEVFIIGHSTGAFYALNLYRTNANIIGLNLINPAIDLLWSLNKNHPDHPLINSNVSEAILLNDKFFKNKVFPIYCYQGLNDDRVHVEYTKNFIKNASGTIDLIPNRTHRFSREEFEMIIDRIFINFLMPV